MGSIKEWLLAIFAACVVCAIGERLMPEGPVKRVGVLVCGLVLLCAILSGVGTLNLEEGQAWVEESFTQLAQGKQELKEQVDEGMKSIIEEQFAAYIVDKATEMGLTCQAEVICRDTGEGIYVPDSTQVMGTFSEEEYSRLMECICTDLGVPEERQSYIKKEDMP
ncbi:MAG: hypothetical protein ACOX7N_07905 [Lawsonibacter sp.]|jgi:hypothetical protein